MANDYLPTKELDLQVWTQNFLTVAGANLAALGLTSADIIPIGMDNSSFGEALTAVATAKSAYESAVKTKDASIKLLDRDVRALVKRIQGHVGVPDALKAQLGITVGSSTRTKTPPVTPAELVATPQAAGVNALKWNAMGNKATTQYVILAKTLTGGATALSDTGWSMVGQTTRSNFAHTGVNPGVPMAYKVLAARANQSSLPSLPVTVYGG